MMKWTCTSGVNASGWLREKAAGITGADSQHALARQDIAQAGGDAVTPTVDDVVHRDRLGATVLHADLKVVLQVGADAGHVGDHAYALRSQQGRRAKA